MAEERLRAEEDLSKAARLPRWTRQELLVLIQGKRVAEGRVGRGRAGALGSQGEGQAEPKWSSVSSYCKRHGVNRGPVQCRKRWSNLAGDFKKIKEWESQIKEEAESFWVMRNDLRRERKLPGFFDREVYDILDAPGDASPLLLSLGPLSLSLSKELVFDSGRPDHHALFSDDAMPTPTPHDAPTPTSATQYEPQVQPPPPPPPPPPPADKETSPAPQGRKRKRPDAAEDMSFQKQLIQAMERNGRLLTSQLEIQNTNSHLDREQRKDHANTLFALLNKLADAMVTIADKL